MAGQSVREWYKDKNIFITGATGFVGVALLEKIVRSIPEHGEIYLLMRPKRGKEISARLEQIKKNLIFEKQLESKTIDEIFLRVNAVAGDVGQPDLGLSAEDRDMLKKKINVIIHSAATLDFAETLKSTVEVNLLGTRRCLELAKQCVNLNAYVQVSSAYVNSWRTGAEEIIYPLSQDPEELIKKVEELTDAELEAATPGLLGDHPNTYTITKHMAEHEVQKCQALFPCTIVRPSMIMGCWEEPIPGWTMSKNGPQGFMMGAAKGVIRRLPVGMDLVYDYIPVDVVVNELLVAACHAGSTNTKTATVYHCTTSTCNPFRWRAVEAKINTYLRMYPLLAAIWYPNLTLVGSIAHFKFSAFFVHMLPAILLDNVSSLFGGKRRLVGIHKKVNASLDMLAKFIFTEWFYDNAETLKLHKWMCPEEQKAFNLDVKQLKWRDYFHDLCLGSRRYLNGESLKNIERARGKNTLFMVVHYTLVFLMGAGIVSLVEYFIGGLFWNGVISLSLLVFCWLYI